MTGKRRPELHASLPAACPIRGKFRDEIRRP